ncbi:MAG: phosphotransferase [Firmicutes bacterium]|nr:phosphotransferase [Bacillota bacterium]
MIPEIKRNAVKQALQAAFGVSEFEDIREMTTGLTSALVFRIVVKGNPYLLRIITRTDAMGDPTRQFACMKAAADAGIAPRVWYSDVQDRISITDFVEARPFPVEEARTRLAELLHELHSLPPFPRIMNFQEAADGFLRKFQEAKILPESMTEELFKQYGRVTAVYPRDDRDLVSCHNDLKPENILFDGERAWLVDWEAAFLNDRYADLAVVANFVVKSDEDEADFLRSYFGEAANEYRHARFYLARQTAHMSYFTVFMLFGAKGTPVDANMKKPYLSFREFHDRIWTGEISLADDEAKLQYALVHMEQLLLNMRTKRFEAALNTVSDY